MFNCNTNAAAGDDDDDDGDNDDNAPDGYDDDGTFITRIKWVSFSRFPFTGAERIKLHFIKAFQSVK